LRLVMLLTGCKVFGTAPLPAFTEAASGPCIRYESVGTQLPFVAHYKIVLSLLYASAYAAALLLLFRFVSAAHLVPARQLRIIGFSFTLVGIATQFVPPVLDLLGIKIV
jgi:hypothetical protein